MSNTSVNSLSLDFEKDLLSLNGIDLLPNSSNFQLDENIRTESTESGYKSSSELNILPIKIMNSKNFKPKQHIIHNKNKTISESPTPSFTSETDSFEDNILVKRKKRKRFCYTCDTEFRRTKDFLSHLRGHVTMPYLNITKLLDDNPYIKAYLDRKIKTSEEPSKGLKLKVKKLAGMLNDENQFRIIEQTDFATIQPKEEILSLSDTERELEAEKLKRPTVRVLRPDEIKKSKSPSLEPSQPMKMLENMQVPNSDMTGAKCNMLHNSAKERSVDNYFECSVADGLDQYNDGGGENTDVLLQKLLNSNQSDLNMNIVESDQWSGNPNQNEYISLDRLAVFCTVCNVNFENEMQLYDHKRITGHDLPMNSSNTPPNHLPPNQMQHSQQRPIQPIHPHQHPHPHPHPHQYNQQQQRFNFQSQQGMAYPPNHPHNISEGRPNGMIYPPGHPHQQSQSGEHQLPMQPGNSYPHPYMYGQGQPPLNYASQQHQQHQMMMRRQPPPLYRVPQPQQIMPPNPNHPSHPYHSQHMQHNNYHGNYPMNPEMSRSGEFMKTRLQKDPNSNTPPISSDQIKQSGSPPVILGNSTQIRPRFLTPPIRTQVLRQHAVSQQQAQAQQAQHAQHAQQRMHQQMSAPALSKMPGPMNNQSHPLIVRHPPTGIKIPGVMVPKPSGHSTSQKEAPPGPGMRLTGITTWRELRPAQKPTASPPRSSDSSQLGPSIKKIKLDLKQPRSNTSSPSQCRQECFPVIKSVIGNAVRFHNPNSPKSSTPPASDRESPIQLNDQITLSMKFGEPRKDPKEVANLLATRGITVTQKSATKLKDGTENNSQNQQPTTAAKEAVQKLQMNNAVSIISKKKSEEIETVENNSNAETSLICNVENCQEKFQCTENLSKHISKVHPPKIANSPAPPTPNNGNFLNIRAFKCKVCPALFSSQDGAQDHQWKQHKITQPSTDELGVPVVDLKNELTKKKLAALGITSYIPLHNKTSSNCYGFPIVSVQGASNSNICNLLGLGASSILSLGPVKPIPKG